MKLKGLLLSVLVATAASADTVHLKTGQVLQGAFLGGDSRNIRLLVNDQVKSVPVGDIADLAFGDGLQPALSKPAALGIPALTNLMVRLTDSVDSKRDQLGQTYRASLAQPIVVDGRVVVPRGADCVVVLTDEHDSGRFTGKSRLTVALQSISIEGKPRDVVAVPFTVTDHGKTGGTLAAAGGGAGLGALIGGLAAGGEGAGIGAGSGAAAGLLGRVLLSGSRVRVPAETVLGFQLQEPLTLQ